ncbi:MAG: DNRLRE domain-containing protein [Polyangiaceae bacterium]
MAPWAALALCGACSVFPDQAVLTSVGGSSGDANGGARASGGSSVGNGGSSNVSGGATSATAGASDAGSGGDSSSGGLDGAGGSVSAGGSTTADGGVSAGGSVGAGGSTTADGGVTTAGGASVGQGGGSGCSTPTRIVLEAIADTYISEAAKQNENFGGEVFLHVNGVAAERMHTLVTFDFSTLPTGIVVQSAVLRFSLGTALSSVHALTVRALSKPFGELRATWIRADQSSKWLNPGGDTAVSVSAQGTFGPNLAAASHVEFNVSADVSLDQHRHVTDEWLARLSGRRRSEPGFDRSRERVPQRKAPTRG